MGNGSASKGIAIVPQQVPLLLVLARGPRAAWHAIACAAADMA